jgi:spiro-SPASM protein
MENLLFLHALGLSEYALEWELPLPGDPGGGKNAFLQTVERCLQLPELTSIVVLTDIPGEKLRAFWKAEWGDVVSRPSWTAVELLQYMRERGETYDHLFLAWADSPLLDIALSGGMYARHRRFFADYTFADGYPLGLSPGILKPSALSRLVELARRNETAVGRDYVFEVLQKDINTFDLETEIAPRDQRLLRVSLSADTRRNFLLLKRVIEAGGNDAESVQTILDTRPELLRTLPAYYNVQIAGGCPQSCSYCPYPQFGGDILARRDEMSLDNWSTLLDQAAEFSGDAVIGISAWGEPALHSRIVEIIAEVLDRRELSLVIETSGVGWSVPALEEIARRADSVEGGKTGRLSWIVSLDADERSLYEKLRGPQFDEARATVDVLRELFPGQVYVQAVRMKSSEDQLDAFFRRWEREENLEVIIQKYDSFCGMLPDRKVTDLTPIERFPCWHLKRDLCILIDGSVPMCREDVKGEYLLGNVFREGIEEIWKRGDRYYRQHIDEKYPPLCEKCDEFYTYNF